ncbi:MAG: glycosyltransferase [Chloroflexi bacterium]|nr:glycosyltransferase [Chloroflexota bacterium]
MKKKIAAPLLWGWHHCATLLFLGLIVPILWVTTKAGIQKRRVIPRVVFGATPIITSKYHSLALQRVAVDSKTVVRGYQLAFSRDDFNIVFGIVEPGWPRWRRWYTLLLDVYVQLAKLLWQRDVFFYYFDGFYLRNGGWLWQLELPALKLLGKRVVVMPYGQDIITVSKSPDLLFKQAFVRDYPEFYGKPQNERPVYRQVGHFGRWADSIIAGSAVDPYFLGHIDYLMPSSLCIDERLWPLVYGPSRSVGEAFRVLHAPNHRHIKGTPSLINAVQRLRDEGLNIELVLLERVPNTEIRRAMADCHVVAEQFIMGWHGVFGLEGMVSGKPVLCYLRPEMKRLYTLYSFGSDCPIVNTPIEKIADNLRWLYHHPEICEGLGRKGRAYVERYHSLEGMGGFLKGVISQVWAGQPFDAEEYWRGRRAMAVPAEGARQPAEQQITAIDD